MYSGTGIDKELQPDVEREWLETNNLGDFASSTAAGMHTRRYHGLLVANVEHMDRHVLLSAVGYASYIIAVNKSRVRDMHSRKLAFYVFVFTTLIFALKNGIDGGPQPLPDAISWVNVVLLAVAPTVISNITLLLAVRYIGGTTTSILGALEPVTAVAIGALVFGEMFTWGEAVGIALILTAVVLLILSQRIRDEITTILKRIRPRHA